MAEKKFEKGKEKKGLMMPGKKIEHPGEIICPSGEICVKELYIFQHCRCCLHYCQCFGKCAGNDVYPVSDR